MPECLKASDIEYMRNQMLLDKTYTESRRLFENEITKARTDTFRRIDNFVHNLKHGISGSKTKKGKEKGGKN